MSEEQDRYIKDVFGFDVAAAGRRGTPDESAAIGGVGSAPRAASRTPSREDRLEAEVAQLRASARGKVKSEIILHGGQLLQRQYDDVIAGLKRARAARVRDIESWRPETTPMAGKVLLGICHAISTAAAGAFPEIKFLEIGAKAIDIAGQVRDHGDKAAEASKDEMEAVKKAATEELDKLVTEAERQASAAQDALSRMIEAAAEGLSPEELDALDGLQEPKKIGAFVRERLGIARGEYHAPGVVARIEIALMTAFNAWVEADFKRRKSAGDAHEVASDGGHSWESMHLHELYAMQQAGDQRGFQITLEALDKGNPDIGIPPGWYSKQLEKLKAQIDGEYAGAFLYDALRFVPE